MLWTSGGSHNGEIHFLTAVNVILDTYTSLKKLNHLGIFPNALNLLEKKKKKNHDAILLGEEEKNKSL